MTQPRLPWIDYFNEPTFEILRENLGEDTVKLFDSTRKKLSGLKDTQEKMTWFGDGWHWTVGYYLAKQEEPLVVIIPNPDDIQLAMPMDRKFIGSLPIQDVKKSLRDGLNLACEPFDTHWGVWSIESETFLSDFMELMQLKLQHLVKAAG